VLENQAITERQRACAAGSAGSTPACGASLAPKPFERLGAEPEGDIAAAVVAERLAGRAVEAEHPADDDAVVSGRDHLLARDAAPRAVLVVQGDDRDGGHEGAEHVPGSASISASGATASRRNC
jgi:hypothetical protein